MNQCDHLKPSEQVSHWSYEGGSVHEMRLFVDKVMKLMTDTMGRMHSDAQFAGSSSVKPAGLL